MELQPIEKQLLNLLADEWDKIGPPGFLETTILAERLNLSLERTKSVIHSLFVIGLVDTDKVEIYAAYLTPQGYEMART